MICCLSIYSQEVEPQEESRIEQLEKKVAAMQDFLSLELQNLKKDLKKQSDRTVLLRKKNIFLMKKVKFLESKVKDLESQILHSKVQEVSENSKNKELAKNEKPKKQQTKYTNRKIRALADEIASPNPDVRMGAVIKLGNTEDEEAIQVLNSALQDKNPYVKVLACKVALQKKNNDLTTNLLSLLEDEDAQVRKYANLALETITSHKVGFDYNSPKETREDKILEWKKKIK